MKTKPIAVVTGANGFVGSHLVDFLLEKAYTVRCIVRQTSNLKYLEGKDVEFYKCGLMDIEALKTPLEGADYVFHIAGTISSKTSAGFYKGNVETTRNILDAAIGNPSIKKIMVTSSLAATGPTKKGNPVNEESPLKPMTTYGFSKLEQEQMVATYMDKLPITIIRPPAVYGPRDSEIFIFFQTINRGIFTQLGFDDKTLSLVHARDLVKGMWLAATSENSSGETYFLGSERPEYAWPEVAKISAKALDKKPIRIKVPHFLVIGVGYITDFIGKFQTKPPTLSVEKAKEIIASSWSCSSEKAIKELGYKQDYTLEAGIQETVDWYKKEKWL